MSVNLCNTTFGVKVSSSTVSTEGHDVSNLLLAGRQNSRNGFMAERFIKPPVDIVFSFPYMIEIKEIFLDPSVGNQVSCGFEIFTDSSPTNQEECNFQSVGKSPWNNSTFCLYHFVNRRYRQRLGLDTGDCSTSNDRGWTSMCGQQSSLPLRHRLSQFLVQVTHVKVKITRTHGGSIPCLRRIEIRGQPSYFCSKADVESFLQKVQLLHKKEEPGHSSRDVKVLSKGPEPEKPDQNYELPVSQDDKQIPEEFKDSLTFDLMSLPVILPSGHTIDQITLDKHTAAEAEWGRPPSDPFTGVAFNDSSKPIPNLLLKSRLDDFILKAGTRYQHLARKTIGISSHGHITHRESPKSISNCEDNKSHLNQAETHHRIRTGAPVSILNSSTSKLRAVIPKDKNDSSGATVKRKIENLDFTSDLSKAKRNSIHGGNQRHEDVVRDSLLSALDATLTKLPSFQEEESSSTSVMTGYSQLTPTAPGLVCNLCGSGPADYEDGSTKHLYQFPCNHIHCRPCLLKSLSGADKGRYTCSTCNVEVDSKDICKLHAIT